MSMLDSLVGIADDMLTQFGQVITITRPGTDEVFDEAADTTTPGTPPVDEIGNGVEDVYSSHSIDGTLIKLGDLKFLLAPLQTNGQVITRPVADRDILTKADGSHWAIKRVDPLAPSGASIMYTLQLRGAV